jgi:hypothetical protein
MRYSLQSVGADVEVFLRDAQKNPTPVCGKLGGTKNDPVFFWQVYGDDYSAYQEDNVMAEFNIIPANSPYEFYINTNRVLKYLQTKLALKDLLVDISPSMEFTKDQLDTPQAQIVGCDPDFNAWSAEQNPILDPAVLGNIRTSGGHIHVDFLVDAIPVAEYDEANSLCYRLVRMLDLTLGVPSVILDTDTRRRQFYGKAGAHRRKPYGVEYRVLSNFWITSRELMEWVFDAVRDAVHKVNSQYSAGFDGVLPKGTCQKIIQCINTADVSLAKDLIAQWGVVCPSKS